MDNHRRKLSTGSDLDIYQEYRKLDDDQKQEMLDIGFQSVPLEKVKNNSYILVGGRYREIKNNSYKFNSYTLNDISSFVRGTTFPKSAQKTSKSADYLKVITTKAAQSTGVKEEKAIYVDRLYLRQEKLLQKDDILISLANSLNLVGRVTFVDNIQGNTTFGAFMGVIRDDREKIIPKLLFYMLQSDVAKEHFLTNAKTTTNISNITFEDLFGLTLPIPTLEVQQQIINELDSYQSIIDGSRNVVDSYLPQINISPLWEPCELEDIVDEFKVGFACGKNNKSEKGILHLRPMNITTKDELVFEGSKYIDNEMLSNKEKYLITKGDILFNNTNSKELVGKTCYIENDINALYSNHITRIRVNPKKANSKFVAIYLHKIWKSGYFLEHCRKWVGQAGIDLEELSRVQLMLPEIEMQNKIVDQINSEQKLIEPSKDIIQIFTKKIQTRINELFIVKILLIPPRLDTYSL